MFYATINLINCVKKKLKTFLFFMWARNFNRPTPKVENTYATYTQDTKVLLNVLKKTVALLIII